MPVALMMTRKMMNVNKLRSTLRKLYHYMPRDSLFTTCISFIRPHLDYADVIFDKPSNATFSNRIESAQYNAALAITIPITLLSPPNKPYNTRKYSKIRQIFRRTETFSNSFLPQTIREWNKLDTSI